MDTTAHTDRRRFERTPWLSDCRLLDPRTGRFLPGESRDRSGGGARVVVRNARHFEPGQAVALLLPTGPRQGVVSAGEALRGVVRRVELIGEDQQEIALEYENAARIAA